MNAKEKTKNSLKKLLFAQSIITFQAKFENLEGLKEFNYSLPLKSRKQGLSAFLRVKNEGGIIQKCLESIIDVFDEIIVVDNASDDSTLEIVNKFKNSNCLDKLKLITYPFKVSRCGPEHAQTPENSVHNLAYYYNYSMSFCTYSYVCKWDADMIFNNHLREDFLIWKENILKGEPKTWNLIGQNVYHDKENIFYTSGNHVWHEIRIFPLSFLSRYIKGDIFEVLVSPLKSDTIPGVVFYEIKSTSKNEFSHWSTENFSIGKTKLEWEVITELLNNSRPNDLVKIDI